MVLALLAISFAGFAQKKGPKDNMGNAEMEKLSPEQRTQLMVKHLDLELDLSDKQEKEIASFLTEQGTKRDQKMAPLKKKKEAGEKLTTEERFALRDGMLDDKIALKEKMKSVLTAEQFIKWEAMKEERKEQQGTRKKMKKQR